jgi:hypothetical protein
MLLFFEDHIVKYNRSLHDFRLPPRSRCEMRSFELLRGEEWLFLTDVSGQFIGPIFYK